MKKRYIVLSLSIIAASVLCLAFMHGFRTSSSRKEDRCPDIEPQPSALLNAALQYIETHPKYKSRYYAGGYPDDHCGTCTDVIGFALRECGYDLRTRLNEDVIAHRERYEIKDPDIDIDFRRVKNLKVYFSFNEQVCTADIQDIGEWLPGDIVIFRDHIGMISDRRNERGIPYVIHHSGPFQLQYEEDILETRNDLQLHIRIKDSSLQSTSENGEESEQ